ncbi:MAG: DUF3422 family protein, partial [Alphaproteobacteria bacterium]|nr:DUF3422 family protein [Alphaproteobacteria bacterium]
MASGLIEHPLRRTLANEVHARPFEVIGSPCRVSHIALLGDETLFVAEWDRLLDLCRRHGVEPPPSTSFISADLGAF